MKNKITPLGLNVLVEMPEKQEKTKGGIYIPGQQAGTAQLMQLVAKIIDCGEDAFTNVFGEKNYLSRDAIGQYAIINMHAGLSFDIEDKKYRLISSDEIRAIISKELYEQIKSKL
jgi:co-chaperonin GroES (HSP10)